MATITMKELLEAGVHFGHQTKRWNPKMKEYIFGERNGIYIIDLQKTLKLFKDASKFVTELCASGKTILFVGTKRQAQDAVAEEANRAGMPYINQRWLGGLLTNWVTVQKSVKRLQELDDMATDGRYELLTKKEVIRLERERKHLQANLAGIKNMKRLPDASLHRRLEQRGDCREGSAQAGHPGGCGGRYQLRSDGGGLRDSGQRRRTARHSPVHLEDRRLGGRGREPGGRQGVRGGRRSVRRLRAKLLRRLKRRRAEDVDFDAALGGGSSQGSGGGSGNRRRRSGRTRSVGF